MARSIVTGTSTAAGSVTVYWYGTTTKPTIYSSATGSSTGNPITAAYDGAYAFWVDNGHYEILNGNGATTVETRITSTNVGQEVPGTSPDRIKFDAFLGSTTANLEAFYEGMVAGTQTLAGGTFTGDIVTTGGLIKEITANGSTCTLSSASENLTLSIVGATTDTTANLLPAGAIILAVTARVTTTITTATDWKLGDPTSATRFAAVNSTMTAGSTSIGLLQMAGDVATVALGPTQAAAAKVRVTTTGTPGAGAIRITVWYLSFVAPTS